MSLNSSRSLPPCRDSTSTRHLGLAPVAVASSSTKAGALAPRSDGRRFDKRAFSEVRGSNRSVHFCRLGRSTPSARAVAVIPSRRASFAAAVHNSCGRRDRTACVSRNSANRRPNCSTSPRSLAGSVMPGSPAPRHTLSATANCSHARLPETHERTMVESSRKERLEARNRPVRDFRCTKAWATA